MVQESLGFSPFELVYGHSVRGPLKVIKEKWLSADDPPKYNLLEYVSEFKERLIQACALAQEKLKLSQVGMKTWYDRKARIRTFKPGDLVLLLLPIQGQPLCAKYSGPYEVAKKLSNVNYMVKTPDRRKGQQLCHVNMMKAYHARDEILPIAHVDIEEVVDGESMADQMISFKGLKGLMLS